ncbi:MAG: hypothetical protein AB1641_28515 [Thermodesulfobacteriota bacterium]
MRPVFCFIDDSRFELDVFSQNIIPAGLGLEFVLGSTYEEVKAALGVRYPCLFVLDLYGRDPGLAEPEIPALPELQSEVSLCGTLEHVYEGLDDYAGDKTNEYLKRLFHLSDGWRRLFYRTSRRAGQSIRYGLHNLIAVRREYPAAAAVAYTRKSLIMDAVEILAAGVDGLDLKPDGPTDKEIRRVTVLAASSLLAAWSNLVTKRFTNYLNGLIVLLLGTGLTADAAKLKRPDTMSDQARELLGPADLDFLRTAVNWWEFTGKDWVL